MKHLVDTKTPELPGIEPAPLKPGRKPIFGRAMTAAERKQRQRDREKERDQEQSKTGAATDADPTGSSIF